VLLHGRTMAMFDKWQMVIGIYINEIICDFYLRLLAGVSLQALV